MKPNKQAGESVVLVNEEKHQLCYGNIIEGSVHLRSKSFSTDEGCMEFANGEDFIIDYKSGTIKRTSHSRIPNWADHVLYGKADFDHNLYKDYSNRNYTVYVDYEFENRHNQWGESGRTINGQTNKITRVIDKLHKGKPVRYVVFGDSISAGGEASRDEFAFYNLFANKMRSLFAGADIEVVNKAIGGENSTGGLARIEKDVLQLKPDLISIGYGMNDQCKIGDIKNGIPPEMFEVNIRSMVEKIRDNTDADIILITPCVSNPLWFHSSGDISIYSEILKKVGRECNTSIADVYTLWLEELDRGKTHESLLLNNINHPNDYGHKIYYNAFEGVL